MTSINSIETIGYSESTPSPVNALSAGYVLDGTFHLKKMLGRGGMGEVWKGYDSVAERNVVLKFVPPKVQNTAKAMESVKNSFQKIHQLQHQHICPVYALLNDPKYGLYIVMKYIDGIPLGEYKRRVRAKYGEMPFTEVVQILWSTARALDYAHGKKVIHRDVKPQNVMVSPKDGVQIIDFGLATDIHTPLLNVDDVRMEVLGTRPYMSPEQWLGKYQDAKSDQYALAATAYELLTGYYPFEGSNAKVLRERALKEMPAPVANVPNYVNDALLKALSKKREDRYENCKSFVKALAHGEKLQRRTTDRRTMLKVPVIQRSTDSSDRKITTWRPKQSLFEGAKSYFVKKSSSVSSGTDKLEPVIKITPPMPGKKTAIPGINSSNPVINPITTAVTQHVSKKKQWSQWLFPLLLAIIVIALLCLMLVSIVPPMRRSAHNGVLTVRNKICNAFITFDIRRHFYLNTLPLQQK